MATKKKRRKLSGAAKKAFLARMKRGRAKARGTARTNPRRKRAAKKRTAVIVVNSGAKTVAKRRKHHRRSAARKNPVRRSRRRTRRNPPMSGIVGKAVTGVKNAAYITAGKMATNFVSRLVPVTSPMLAIAVRAGVALGVGIAAESVLGREAGELALAGGLTAPIESAVRAINVPLLTGALSSDEALRTYARRIGSYPQVGSYPQRRMAAPTMGSYPQAQSRGRLGDAGSMGMAYSRNGGASMM